MFGDCFRLLINEKDAKRFIKEIRKLKGGHQFAFSVFLNYPSESDMYKNCKIFFPRTYAKFEIERKKYARKFRGEKTENIDIYTQFKNKLGSRGEKYYNDVFEFYLRNAAHLSLTSKDIEHFKEIVFFNLSHNPLEGQVNFTDRSGSGTTYTMTRHMNIFPECLAIAKKLSWDLSGVQQNILNCIPCAYHEELKLIFECINDAASLDIRPILTVYTERPDDLALLRPESFMRACEKYRIISAIPILDRFVGDANLLVQDRRLAIEVSNKLSPDQDKLRGYFVNYRDIPENK